MKKQPTDGAYARARALRREMTEAEKNLWQMLRSRQIAGWRFRRQVPIGRHIADFACHEARLIIEVDGGQHDLASEMETSRTGLLENEGYRVLRFWNNEVLAIPDGVYAMIVADLQDYHPHPSPPPSRVREPLVVDREKARRAAADIITRRQGVTLGDGVSVKELIDEGR